MAMGQGMIDFWILKKAIPAYQDRIVAIDINEVTIDGSVDLRDWRNSIIEYLKDPSSSVPRNIWMKAVHYQLLYGCLYKKDQSKLYLKCLGKSEAYLTMLEVHEGICRGHQSGRKMMKTLSRHGFYSLTMMKDCIEFAKRFFKSQIHMPIQRAPTRDMEIIMKPWPFRCWGIDMIGKIMPSSSK
ncbi:uncharacterized protein [Coffea arabica]|uniref:Integrase zinc-binding domain-containing protein n=1 Tax=Coffea arabica TaxID=13443 RepID=A0ABM4X543_COFAR